MRFMGELYRNSVTLTEFGWGTAQGGLRGTYSTEISQRPACGTARNLVEQASRPSTHDAQQASVGQKMVIRSTSPNCHWSDWTFHQPGQCIQVIHKLSAVRDM